MIARHKRIAATACIFFLCLGGFSVYKIYGILAGYSEAAHAYDSIRQEYVQHNTEEQSGKTDNQDIPAGSSDNTVSKELSPLDVDFDELRSSLNPEVIAWIWCQDTVIDYPVVQHADNEYYLNYNVNGEQNASGAIFLESANFSDFRDVNNILHGHHMGDGSMFASLDHWQADEYFDSHPVMYLNTPSGNYRVDLFAGFTTPANSRAYQYEFSGRSDIQNWIDWVRKESVINPDVTLSVEDRFITLSTCAYSYENARTVLIGRLTPLG